LTGTETLLVVDDDASVREVARRILATLGYTVITASGGEDALRTAAGARIDLLVSDVVMPDTNGPLLARRLREERSDLKVLSSPGTRIAPSFRTGWSSATRATCRSR
jgi:two-component system cell cycle sensor histidine kinase/response regulator CckA